MGIMDMLEALDDWVEEEPAQESVPEALQPPEPQAPVSDAPEVPEQIQIPEPAPSVEEPDEEEDLPTAEEAALAKGKRRPLRPEWIMAMIALFAAVLLGFTVILAQPHWNPKSEDPEALPERHPSMATQPIRETILEPTIPETEPENPTIPPERNPYDRYDFQYDRHNYLFLQNVKSYAGVDVSAYQGDIDWKKVKASGIDFAMIRLGYRGYESGKLVEDTKAKQNLENAKAAGLRIGAYFFSQALSIKEADQEIDYMLKILGDTALDMPIVLDWEIPASTARTVNMDALTLTDIQRHFCGQMRDRGYQPMVYFNWHQSENLYYLSELEDYPFWLALYQDRMTYPWRVEMWQWTDSGRVPGISGNVDLNVYMPH